MIDAPIVWLNRVVDAAAQERISDLHLEYVEGPPQALNVRVRLDGQLQAWEGLAGQSARSVISRIKSMANITSGQVRKAEEGRYVHYVGSGRLSEELESDEYDAQAARLEKLDLRLVVLPSNLGETLVLRLPSLSEIPDVDALGFSEYNFTRLQRIFNNTSGLTLFAGPVNAGKTTSMYSVLSALGGPDKAVYSVEDPIERTLPSVTQIEVNAGAGNSYGSVLRAIRRADLNMLMIGEIRDAETASAALNISAAGSLVVSSIHANDSVGSVTSMLELSHTGPHQVMQSVRGVVSQRLVRRMHAECGGAGCEVCYGLGSKGVLALHEVLLVDDDFRDAVVRQASRRELQELAVAGGMTSLRDDADYKVAQGLTRADWVQEVLGVE